MNSVLADHPSSQRLSAFGLGKLSPDECSAVERHVAQCDTCCDALRQVRNDTLADLVRKAQAASAEDTMPGLVKGVKLPDMPAELVNHSRYRVIAQLGAGGMGVVYRAEHRLMERPVALKVISPEFLDNPNAVQRFHQEVKAAAKLLHPNIVAAHDAEQAGDSHFLVMEYVDGSSLARVVEKRGPLPVQHACHYIRQAALGLQHAHDKGMTHRDIKPQNLMLTRKGQVKILDFGLARLGREREEHLHANARTHHDVSGLTSASTVLGTPDYIAPEQVNDARRADQRSDIYSLGCTLYYMLSGRVPFPGGTSLEKLMQHAMDQPSPLTAIRPEVPEGLAAIVEKMMAKKAEDRYQRPAEIAEALLPFSRSAGSGGTGKEEPLAVAMLLPEPEEAPVATAHIEPSRSRSQSRRRARFRRPSLWAKHGSQAIALGVVLLILAGGATAFVKYALPYIEKQRAAADGAEAKNEGNAGAADRPQRPVNEGRTDTQRPAGERRADQPVDPTPKQPAAGTGKRVLMVIASHDFYYPDYGPVKDRFVQAGFQVKTAASQRGVATPMVGGNAPEVMPDLTLAEARSADYDAIVFCGGMGVLNEYCEGKPHQAAAMQLINAMLQENKLVTALCGGPAVLADAGVLRGKRATCYGDIKYGQHLKAGGALLRNLPVVEDGQILTGRGPQDADEFANALIRRLQ